MPFAVVDVHYIELKIVKIGYESRAIVEANIGFNFKYYSGNPTWEGMTASIRFFMMDKDDRKILGVNLIIGDKFITDIERTEHGILLTCSDGTLCCVEEALLPKAMKRTPAKRRPTTKTWYYREEDDDW